MTDCLVPFLVIVTLNFDLVSRIDIKFSALLLYSLRKEFQIRCVDASWDDRASRSTFWVTMTLTSDLVLEQLFPEHFTYIIWAWDSKFGVHLYFGMAEFHVVNVF